MRHAVVALVAFLAFASSAYGARVASVLEQYDQTAGDYLVDPGPSDAFLTGYSAKLMDGLDGRWFPISIVAQMGPLTPEAVASACAEHRPMTIAVRDRYTIETSNTSSKGARYTTLYTAMRGNWFGVYTEPLALLAFLGIDPADPSRAQMIAVTLQLYNGLAVLRRPSSDILAVETMFGNPVVWGRCTE
jgi:hypothetical protein